MLVKLLPFGVPLRLWGLGRYGILEIMLFWIIGEGFSVLGKLVELVPEVIPLLLFFNWVGGAGSEGGAKLWLLLLFPVLKLEPEDYEEGL